MAQTFLEHVNITVGSPKRSADMVAHLFGWALRWQGRSASGGYTIHIGNDRDYIAFSTPATSDGTPYAHQKSLPMNHIGVVVDDLDKVEARAIEIGLKPFNHDDYEPGRRFYLFDGDGIEWEIVSYTPASKAKP